MVMPYMIADSGPLSKMKTTLGDLAMIAGLDFGTTQRKEIFGNTSNDQGYRFKRKN